MVFRQRCSWLKYGITEKTSSSVAIMLGPFCETPVGQVLCGQLGMEVEVALYLTFMLLAYPMNYILYKLPLPVMVKHIYCTAGGIFFSWAVFGNQVGHPLLTTFVTFFIIKFFPKDKCVPVVFLFSVTYMSVSHIFRQYNDYLGWSLDYTGPQMILTLKYIGAAWNVYDGRRKDKENMSDAQKAMAVKDIELLEYFSYCFYFGGFLSGPFLDYRNYLDCISQSVYVEKGVKKLPATELPALRRFAEAVVIALLQMKLESYFSYQMTYTPEFEANPLHLKIGIWVMILFTIRTKYFFAWRLAEGSWILGGIGYTGKDKKGNPTWDRACNVRILEVEFGENLREVIAAWNCNTAYFLREYVYLRVPHKYRAYNTVSTFAFSAFWHGFYPGYYLYFVTMGGVTTPMAQNTRRLIRPYFMLDDKRGSYPVKHIYDIVGRIITHLTNNYLAIGFQVLAWEHCVASYARLNYCGHIFIAAMWSILFVLKKVKGPTKKSAKASSKKAE